MFGKNLRYVLAIAALAALTFSLPQVGDAMYNLFSVNPPATLVAAANNSQAVTVSEIKAKMGYDKQHQETTLSVTAKVKISATDSQLTIAQNSFGFVLKNKTFNRDGGYGYSQTVSASKLKKNADGAYTLKKGSSETFTVVMEYNPRSLIAGQYYASLAGVSTVEGKMTVSSNKSNTVIAVGEAGPYIAIAGLYFMVQKILLL